MARKGYLLRGKAATLFGGFWMTVEENEEGWQAFIAFVCKEEANGIGVLQKKHKLTGCSMQCKLNVIRDARVSRR